MNRIFWPLLVIVIIGFDQVTKWLTESMLPLERKIDLLPFLSLYRTYNEGVAFSFLSNLDDRLLVVMTLLIIAFIIWLWRSLEVGRPLSELGFALIMGGALGNLIDRIWLGKVIDMIYFHIDAIDFHFAVFNWADTFISLGAGAIILDEFLRWQKNRHTKGEA